ncbi:MAG: Transcription termination factor NusA [Candidatus Roizmanbacteria bacterium GW2011_GWA2_37_7]|uniref:Transcription termination/antitermination protein NusA n=1 Tax=Candidatus Roizmanbacteria bacterium GW2011_GWA2_37_7 TaxID=1618481 RepID=A0A0G0HIT5_9BACT|nr:MAG: Transcription termination factor NusA [Candidatus Roizmanbacteria bacterium GW2011_GWA2_37_7]
MVIVKSEFALALNQVASERGITVSDVIESMQAAILAAFRKEHPEISIGEEDDVDPGVEVKIDQKTGETQILKDGENITPPGFGRIAAQTARQVIIQKIREAEKKTVISHYQDQIGTIVRGRVIRRDLNNVYVDIGKTEGVLPRDEQIRNETYVANNRYVFYLKEIATTLAGYSRIILSRAHPKLIAELFKREVPEIGNETVEIKNIVREPGERAKIAVFSSQSGVDPVGACVGQKGVRVQTVTDELNGKEKIDIIQWNEDPKLFIISALSPAEVQQVELDKELKRAKVTVLETQAPLAIGKGGANVNLAARLTGYEIDIVQVDDPNAPKKEDTPQAEQITSEDDPQDTGGETKATDKKSKKEASRKSPSKIVKS